MTETEFLNTAEEAARLAGEVLSQWSEKFTVREKARANLVTEADFAAQDAIHRFIHSRYPEHNFLGEEELSELGSDSPYRWVIDPLDGTSNYVHRFPYYAVSIALELKGELTAGVVFDPNRGEMFSASRSAPATLNGVPIQPTSNASLESCLVVASLPNSVARDDPAVQRFLQVLPFAQSLQRTGSAALNMAYVAAGRVDAFFSTSLKPWDMAAGALIVTRAGGRVSATDGRDFDLGVPDLLCSNGTELHEQLCGLLS